MAKLLSREIGGTIVPDRSPPIYENAAMTIELILSVVALAIALYGAALSTHFHVRRVRSEQIDVSVSIYTAYPLTDTGIEAMPKTLGLVAVNTCRRDVVVDGLFLEIYGFACLSPQIVNDPDVEEDGPRPRALEPGHRFETSFNYPHLIEWLLTRRRKFVPPIRVRGMLLDTLGNRFYSRWRRIGGDDIPLDEARAPLPDDGLRD